MKSSNSVLTIILILVLMAGAYFARTYSINQTKTKAVQEYAQKFEYNESEVNKLKRELDEQRLKSLKLQAALDSCQYPVTPAKIQYTYGVKVKTKPKVSYKAKNDSTLAILNQKRLDCSDLEINLNEQLVKKNRQLDTAVAVLNLYDKALVEAQNKEVQLINQKDSLIAKLHEPITVAQYFPCVKAKFGLSASAEYRLKDGDGRPPINIDIKPYTKKEYKVSKKTCKKANTR